LVSTTRTFAWSISLWCCGGFMEYWLHTGGIIYWQAYLARKDRGTMFICINDAFYLLLQISFGITINCRSLGKIKEKRKKVKEKGQKDLSLCFNHILT
jgi:hypothetical protein